MNIIMDDTLVFYDEDQVEENAGAMSLGPLKENQILEIGQILGRG